MARTHDHGMLLAGSGMAVGLAGSLALTRVMASLLFGVGARDPWTFILVPVVLAAVALFACYLPAWRAARVNPIEALRYEESKWGGLSGRAGLQPGEPGRPAPAWPALNPAPAAAVEVE